MRKIILSIATCIALYVNAQTSDFTETDHVKELYNEQDPSMVERDNLKSGVQKMSATNSYYVNVSEGPYKPVSRTLSLTFNYPSNFSTNESKYYSNETLCLIVGGIMISLISGIIIVKYWG